MTENVFELVTEELVIEMTTKLLHLRNSCKSYDEYYQQLHFLIDDYQIKAGIPELIGCTTRDCSFCCHDKIIGAKAEIDYVLSKATYINPVVQTEENYESLSFKDKACPLLKDGKCTVYEFRPIICRTHNVDKETKSEDCIITPETNNGNYSSPDLISLYYADMSINGGPTVLNYKANDGR